MNGLPGSKRSVSEIRVAVALELVTATLSAARAGNANTTTTNATMMRSDAVMAPP